MVTKEDRKMERGIARLFAERFPEIGELDERDWEANRVLHIVLSTAVPKKTGGNIVNERYIFRRILNTQEGESSIEAAYGHIRALVRKAECLGRRQLAMARLEGTDELIQRKMLECLTARSGMQVELYVPTYASKMTSAPKTGENQAPSTAGTTNEGDRWQYLKTCGPKAEVLVVKAKDKSAKVDDVIRQMKARVDISKVDVKVKSLTGAENGRISVKLAPAQGTTAPKLRKTVLDAMVTAEIVATRQLVMRDLGRTVTENEIRAAIGAVIVPNETGEHIQNSDL
ncbi:hypothetical protein MTP99_004886 [Tenebrio molitor]|jgi:hypothetical protein|nr:hypothetical protein MTP99_004886 [Tenebrio molitor]